MTVYSVTQKNNRIQLTEHSDCDAIHWFIDKQEVIAYARSLVNKAMALASEELSKGEARLLKLSELEAGKGWEEKLD